MPSTFTVIQAVRQRFGERIAHPGEILLEQEAPFVGGSKDFPFSCPNVLAGEFAVLQFESLGVTADGRVARRNILRINGVDIPGGITPGAGVEAMDGFVPLWKSHTLLVSPNVLREQNVLRIESILIQWADELKHDNFIIDNIVVFFKTRQSPVGGGTIGPKPRVPAKRSKAKPAAGPKKNPLVSRGRKK